MSEAPIKSPTLYYKRQKCDHFVQKVECQVKLQEQTCDMNKVPTLELNLKHI